VVAVSFAGRLIGPILVPLANFLLGAQIYAV